MQAPVTYKEIMQQRSDEAILGALMAVNGNRHRAATLLKMSVRNFLLLLQKMRDRGVDVPSRQRVKAA
jgi:DNA-binding NtrC family response regulator